MIDVDLNASCELLLAQPHSELLGSYGIGNPDERMPRSSSVCKLRVLRTRLGIASTM